MIEARLKLVEHLPDYIAERQQELCQEFNSERARMNSSFQHLLSQELSNEFFTLKKKAAHELYKNEKHPFCSTQHTAADDSSVVQEDEAQQQFGIFSSPVLSGGARDMDFNFSLFE